MNDIIIIGGGPAGLTAAIYASRAGKSVLLIEKQSCGGQIVTSPKVENYPGIPVVSGFEYGETLKKQAKSFGAQIISENVLSIEVKDGVRIAKTAKNSYEGKTIIYAAGAEKRKLGIEREEELIGSGISYCAYCDGNFFRGRTAAVVGGGNTALDDALYLSEICKKVYLIHRRHQFRGDEATVERLRKIPNVEIICGYTVDRLIGDFMLSAIHIKSTEDKEPRMIETDGLFIAIGNTPGNENFKEWFEIDTDGYIVTDEACRTKTPGIFAAGDCRQKNLRQLVTAAADGAISAVSAVEYINNR